MKSLVVTLLVGLGLAAHAADPSSRITPAMQAEIDAQKKVVASWAANPTLVAAVKAQNARGPIADMTNRRWKKLSPDDPLVTALQRNEAGVWLARKLAGNDGIYREAFLNAARGEKAAFAAKPSSYLHAGEEKFTVPMTGRIWQGEPEFDKSSHSYVVQLAAPVVSGGRPIGVLVVGVSMKMVRTMTR